MVAAVADAAAALAGMVTAGFVRPVVDAVYPLRDGARALQDRRVNGNVVLQIRP